MSPIISLFTIPKQIKDSHCGRGPRYGKRLFYLDGSIPIKHFACLPTSNGSTGHQLELVSNM